jgi:hypothetical protein
MRSTQKQFIVGLITGTAQLVLLLVFERTNRSLDNVLDYLNGLAYHIVNMGIGVVRHGDGWPVQYYEWRYHRWQWWLVLSVLVALQWFVMGAAAASLFELKKGNRLLRRWRSERILLIAVAIITAYVVWYSYLFVYSNRWSITHLMTRYEDCGSLGPLSSKISGGDVTFEQLERSANARNAVRKKFLDCFDTSVPARMRVFHVVEEYPSFVEYLYCDSKQLGRQIWQVYNFRNSYRFRDLSWRGWSQEKELLIRGIRLMDFQAAIKLTGRQNLPWVERHPDLLNLCLVIETIDGTYLLY